MMQRSAAHKGLVIGMLAMLPLFAMAAGFASRPPAPAAPAPPTPPVIVTVDISAVIKGLDEYKAMNESLKVRGEQFQASLQAKRAAIEEDQKAYDIEVAGPKKKELAQKIIRDALQLKFDTTYATEFMDQMEGEQLREISDRVAAACRELAAKNKYTIIMAEDSDSRPGPAGKNEVGRQIMSKRFWYVDPAHDVTKELIDLMNNQYAAMPKGT